MKYPIHIFESKIPKILSIFINIGAITLWPFVIYRNKREDVSEATINHESIHIEQQKELWVIFFYALYVYYWANNKFLKKMSNDDAYMNIPFEKEAYSNHYDMKYLSNREKHSWKKYIG
jgi:hypothetical protein